MVPLLRPRYWAVNTAWIALTLVLSSQSLFQMRVRAWDCPCLCSTRKTTCVTTKFYRMQRPSTMDFGVGEKNKKVRMWRAYTDPEIFKKKWVIGRRSLWILVKLPNYLVSVLVPSSLRQSRPGERWVTSLFSWYTVLSGRITIPCPILLPMHTQGHHLQVCNPKDRPPYSELSISHSMAPSSVSSPTLHPLKYLKTPEASTF